MTRCKNCIHFGICKKGFPWSDGKGGGWCEDFKDKANFIEVVKCKDCKHCVVREYDIIDELECDFFDVFTDPLDYCSRGERKE